MAAGTATEPGTGGSTGAPSAVTLGLVDPDGTMGFPGTVTATCRYSLVEGPALQVDLTATTDTPTLVNLGHHSYFCLDMSGDIRNQKLQMDASRVSAG